MLTVLNPIIAAGHYSIMRDLLTEEDQRLFIRTFPRTGVFLVAICTDSQQLLGLQDVVPKADKVGCAEISTFIALDVHRQGIGQQLCAVTFESAQKAGFHSLNATILSSNTTALRFYKHQGFEIIGYHSETLTDGRRVNLVLCEKRL